MKIAIIIPAYNEEKTLGHVLSMIPSSIVGIGKTIIIVVNDGSKDDTGQIAKRYSKYVINHILNQGVGSALISGYKLACKLNCDIAISVDADGQHNPENIKQLVIPIIENKAHIVIGNRMNDTKNMPVIKIFGNWCMNVITFLIFRYWVSDSQSGMKAISLDALKKMRLYSTGYEISSEIIGEAKRNTLKLCEVPIDTIYSEYSKLKGQHIINGINILTRLLMIKLAPKK